MTHYQYFDVVHQTIGSLLMWRDFILIAHKLFHFLRNFLIFLYFFVCMNVFIYFAACVHALLVSVNARDGDHIFLMP